MDNWQWIPPTVAAGLGVPGVGIFLLKVLGGRLNDIKDRLDKVNGFTQKNTADIAGLKATCREREAFMKRI